MAAVSAREAQAPFAATPSRGGTLTGIYAKAVIRVIDSRTKSDLIGHLQWEAASAIPMRDSRVGGHEG